MERCGASYVPAVSSRPVGCYGKRAATRLMGDGMAVSGMVPFVGSRDGECTVRWAMYLSLTR